jgi:hypothetical protein
MRRLFAFLPIFALLALGDSPAAAKDLGTVRITGPSLTAPIELGERQTEHWWLEVRPLDPKQSDAATTDLGPRFEVELTPSVCGSGDPQTIREVLYPYAEGGPEIFTPGGQDACLVVPAGWSNGSMTLLAMLEAEGLPEPKPEATPSKSVEAAVAAVPSDPPRAGSGLTVWPIVLVLAVVLAVGAFVAREHTRRMA